MLKQMLGGFSNNIAKQVLETYVNNILSNKDIKAYDDLVEVICNECSEYLFVVEEYKKQLHKFVKDFKHDGISKIGTLEWNDEEFLYKYFSREMSFFPVTASLNAFWLFTPDESTGVGFITASGTIDFQNKEIERADDEVYKTLIISTKEKPEVEEFLKKVIAWLKSLAEKLESGGATCGEVQNNAGTRNDG